MKRILKQSPFNLKTHNTQIYVYGVVCHIGGFNIFIKKTDVSTGQKIKSQLYLRKGGRGTEFKFPNSSGIHEDASVGFWSNLFNHVQNQATLNSYVDVDWFLKQDLRRGRQETRTNTHSKGNGAPVFFFFFLNPKQIKRHIAPMPCWNSASVHENATLTQPSPNTAQNLDMVSISVSLKKGLLFNFSEKELDFISSGHNYKTNRAG